MPTMAGLAPIFAPATRTPDPETLPGSQKWKCHPMVAKHGLRPTILPRPPSDCDQRLSMNACQRSMAGRNQGVPV